MTDSCYLQLGLDPRTIVRTEHIPGGIGDGNLMRVIVEHRDSQGLPLWQERHVVKRLASCRGWLGVASDDTLMRELTLWEMGTLTRLPASVATGVQGWAHTGEGGALLMRDLDARFLLRQSAATQRGLRSAVVARLLDALAHVHARFWNDARLDDPQLGLMSAERAIGLVGPETIAERMAAGDTNAYLPLAARGWETFFASVTPGQAVLFRALLADPTPLARLVAALPRALIHGDVWAANLATLPATQTAPRLGPRVVLLDWALATAGPAPYDPLWLAFSMPGLDVTKLVSYYRARLTAILDARGIALPGSVWSALADAAYLRTALCGGETLGQFVAHAGDSVARAQAMARLTWWVRCAERAAQRLGIVR